MAFIAYFVARRFDALRVVQTLRVKVPVDLPLVGMITLRGQLTTSTTEFMQCVRQPAKGRRDS